MSQGLAAGSSLGKGPPRAALMVVWVVVNLVNLLQSAGFATRTIDPAINHTLGVGILVLGIPAGLALASLIRTRAGWRYYAGPVAFLAFVIVSITVDYLLEVEFRSPRRIEILSPYLVIFFGSIVLMGAPMLRVNRRLWAVTAATSAILLGSMGLAIVQGVG